MLHNPDLELANGHHLRCLRGEGKTQLRLSARAPQEQHQLACGLMRQTGAAILLHPCQSQIDASRNASRGVDISVFDPKWIVLDAHPRKPAGHFPAKLPMRSCRAAVQESSLSDQKCANA